MVILGVFISIRGSRNMIIITQAAQAAAAAPVVAAVV